MKIRLLGSSVQYPARLQYVSSYLINGTVAIDAGCLGSYGTPQQQEAIRHVFLTHSHADHTASLPIFLENAWTPAESCPHIYGSPEALDSVQKHIFNNVMWPDFVALSGHCISVLSRSSNFQVPDKPSRTPRLEIPAN